MSFFLIANLIIFEALIIVVHLTVYATLSAAFGIGGPWLEALFVVLALTFVSASVLSHFRVGKWEDGYYVFAGYWFGLVHALFGAGVVFYFSLKAFYAANIAVSTPLLGGILFGAAFLVHLYGTWNSQHPRITRTRVPFSHLPGFRADFWKDKKLVFVSDFQLGKVWKEGYAAKVVKIINEADPYAVFIGGDLYDGVVCDEEAIIAPLKELHPPGGVFFITGNHEYYLPHVERGIAAVKGLGIKILDNEKMTIGDIEVIGVDDRLSNKKEEFAAALAHIGVDRGHPSILLKHQPVDLETAEAAGISLSISGHTHHGQIFPLMVFTWQIYKGFDYGLKKLGNMQVLVSSGVGTWGPPLRLGTKAEIVEIELY